MGIILVAIQDELMLFLQKLIFALTLKALSKIVADNSLIFFYYFFRENKTWHFMRIVC